MAKNGWDKDNEQIFWAEDKAYGIKLVPIGHGEWSAKTLQIPDNLLNPTEPTQLALPLPKVDPCPVDKTTQPKKKNKKEKTKCVKSKSKQKPSKPKKKSKKKK